MPKKIPFAAALLGLLCTAAVLFFCLVKLGLSPQIPLLLGCGVSAVIALLFRWPWETICRSMVDGITQSLEAVLILLLIGTLIGVWIISGVVPAMIYYGLKLISPHLFLASAMLVCALISMALGSWGTAGTVGLAFMGMAQTMGIPLPITAGAIISGSYVGDKLSPMADSTNLASAVAGVKIFENIRNIFKVAMPMLILTLGLYAVVGWKYGGNMTPDALENMIAVSDALGSAFRLDFFSFLPLFILLACILWKIPAIPSIFIGILTGCIYGMIAQGASIRDILDCAYSGYTSHTGFSIVDDLLTAGGLSSMFYSVSIVILAMAFGGVMEKTGQMEVLIAPIVRHTKNFVSLMAATVATCVCVNVVLPDQYIAIVLPGRMYAAQYDKQGMERRDLALGIGVGGAMTSALVPWNTCGIFMSSVLGISAAQYFPYAYYNIGMLFAAVIYAALRQYKAGKRTPASCSDET
ncbi:MAG: Na+/H+ antiporter NhaC [Oscillibacter sp.]|nr:Na+/H+ antiporter NhaC [Oscillibacter sp.]